MTQGKWAVSKRELGRMPVIPDVVEKRPRLVYAADRLRLSVWQAQRLVARYRAQGAALLV